MSDKLLSVKDELLLDKIEDVMDRKIDKELSEILKRMDRMENHIDDNYARLNGKFMELWQWRCDTDKRLVEIRAILNVTSELASRTYNRIERLGQKLGQKHGIRKFFL